ncbi:MAG: OB-fold nucleic acid binding domain-containing protein [Candidatus Pacearchaeota archaeon]|jgi:hypothetical protein
MNRLFLAISLGGILILLILNLTEPPLKDIKNLDKTLINHNFQIVGRLINVNVYENNFTVAKILDNSTKIDIVCNCPKLINYINKTLKINGKVSEYNGKIQLQADKIIYLN